MAKIIIFYKKKKTKHIKMLHFKCTSVLSVIVYEKLTKHPIRFKWYDRVSHV